MSAINRESVLTRVRNMYVKYRERPSVVFSYVDGDLQVDQYDRATNKSDYMSEYVFRRRGIFLSSKGLSRKEVGQLFRDRLGANVLKRLCRRGCDAQVCGNVLPFISGRRVVANSKGLPIAEALQRAGEEMYYSLVIEPANREASAQFELRRRIDEEVIRMSPMQLEAMAFSPLLRNIDREPDPVRYGPRVPLIYSAFYADGEAYLARQRQFTSPPSLQSDFGFMISQYTLDPANFGVTFPHTAALANAMSYGLFVGGVMV